MKLTKSKANIAFAVLGLFIAGIGLFNVLSAREQQAAALELSDRSLPSVTRIGELKFNVNRLRVNELDYVLTRNDDVKASIMEAMDEATNNMFIYSKTYQQLINEESVQKQFDEYKKTWEDYSAMHDKIIEAVNKKDYDAASAAIDKSDELYETLNRVSSALSNYHADEATKRNELAAAKSQQTQIILGVLASLSVIFVFLAGAYVRIETKQQIGPVAVSTGDVSLSLSQTAEILVESTESLASQTTESAASLEETVASIEELTSLVKMNAETAEKAVGLSTQSQTSVVQGQQEIQTMIENIKDVYESSKKIADILLIIEDIAFQTNLLALNAAVEAARAGEQGKGFAVVADAVRTLAQNSSNAAKQIGDLIHSSNSKTQKGMELAGNSEKFLNDMVKSVQGVANLIKDIANAAKEQNQGISQIGEALNQIDQTIQSSSSSTENIAGLAMQLKLQSSTLSSLSSNLRDFAGVQNASVDSAPNDTEPA